MKHDALNDWSLVFALFDICLGPWCLVIGPSRASGVCPHGIGIVGGCAMPVAALVLRPVLEPGDEAHELLDGFFVGLAAFFGGGQLRLAQHAGFGIAARPRNDRRRAGGEQVDPVERAVFVVERDRAALDLVLADVVAVEIQVQRRFQLAGVRSSRRETCSAASAA